MLSVIVLTTLSAHAGAAQAAEERYSSEPQLTLCDQALLSASELSAMALFSGADKCAVEERPADVNMLLLAGQVRATADMTIFPPADERAEQSMVTLYSALYFQYGGMGFTDVYRDPGAVDEIAGRVRDLGLALDENYDPGWSYRQTIKISVYQEVLENALNQRLWQVRNLALRFQDDAYYALHMEQTALQRENPVFEAGSPASTRSAEIMTEMREISGRIRDLPPPEDTTPYAILNAQEPELARRQIASGVNGPARSGTYLFLTAAELRGSWVSDALSDDELERIVAEVDFETQVVVGISTGEQSNASGEVLISDLRHRELQNSYTIAVRVGVVPPECNELPASSYPFALGTVEAHPQASVSGYSRSNFPAECGPIRSGKPAAAD